MSTIEQRMFLRAGRSWFAFIDNGKRNANRYLMCGVHPRPFFGHFSRLRLCQRLQDPLLKLISCRRDSSEIVTMILSDSVRHDEVKRKEHAGAQFSWIYLVDVHVRALSECCAANAARL